MLSESIIVIPNVVRKLKKDFNCFIGCVTKKLNTFFYMKLHLYYVYILTTKNKTVLYTGVTNYIKRRVFEHKSELYEGFTKKYHVHKLIYYELFDFIDLAIAREKQIKGYSREKKTKLIDSMNPDWKELEV